MSGNSQEFQLGKYTVRGTLGKGAMGTVYDGWDPVIDRRVAIKTVRLPEAHDEEAQEGLARFKREAQAAGRLHHPNIVGVYDYGETDEVAFIVMEFVDGKTLKEALGGDERLPLAETVRIVQDVLAGLAYSHERGVVHRDIKPANIMLTSTNQAKIADFGIARIESSSMTQAGTVLGTPAYMSPEQFMGQTVDRRTDIYSLGVLLYQLLTGERPFEGSLTGIMHKVLNTVPPNPSELSVTAPMGLDAVVSRAMARRPEDRFESAQAFSQAIERALDPLSAAGPADSDATIVRPVISAPPAAVPPVSPPAAASTPPPAGSRKMPLLIAGVIALLVIGSAGAWFTLSGKPDQAVVASADRPGSAGAPKGPSTPSVPLAQPAPPSGAAAPPSTPPDTMTAGGGPANSPLPASASPPATTRPPPSAQISPPIPLVPAAPPPPAPVVPSVRPSDTLAMGTVAPPVLAPIAPPAPPPVVAAPNQAPAASAPQASAPQAPVPQAPVPQAPVPQAPVPQAPVPQALASVDTSLSPEQKPTPPARSASTVGRALAASLPGMACTFVQTAVSQNAAVTIGGVAGSGASERNLRKAVTAADPSAIDWRVASFDGPYCPALDLLRPVGDAAFRAGSGLAMTEADGSTRLSDGQVITVSLTMPSFGGYLSIAYLQHDGTAATLVPGAGYPARTYAAGERVEFGRPAGKFPGWQVGPPFGTDMIIAVASTAPLFTAPLPDSETIGSYLQRLQAAMDNLRRRGGTLAANVILLETVPGR